MIRQHLLVDGTVQCVGYRWSMAREARGLGVRGWVRNRPDGTVEAVAEGPDEAVATLVAWCRSGPGGAQVTGVEVSDETPEGLPGFEIEA